MSSLGDECAKALANKLKQIYSSGDDTIDMTDLCKNVLADNNRWYVKIGKSALLNEANVLNKASSACKGRSLAKVTMHKKAPKGFFRTIVAAFGEIGSICGEAIEETVDEYGITAKTALKKEYDELLIPNKSTSAQAEELLQINDEILSSGAGGFRKIIATKFTCYSIKYPKINFENKEQIKKFTENMKTCKTVPNSLFCSAGSAKIYKKVLDQMK